MINHKLNGVHQCFIMKVKEVLNRSFHVYAINVTMITYMGFFFGIPYYAFTLNARWTSKPFVGMITLCHFFVL
jgi:hypothetical protein